MKKFSEKRSNAIDFLKKKPTDIKTYSPEEISSMLQELDDYQFEMEMQNEELRQALSQLSQSENKYSELYQNAPCGYLTLDSAMNIIEANLMASTLLGVTTDRLLGECITTFISPEDQGKLQGHYFKVQELNSPSVPI